MRRKYNYRKIYETYHGSISKDDEGRSYDIHHIDGNHANNDPSNLKAVTIKEHYDIHYQRGDYGACKSIAMRMKIDPQEFSELTRKFNKKQIEAGTHNFLDSNLRKKIKDIHCEKVKNGTHPFQKGNKGYHIARKIEKQRLEDGSHNLLGKNNPVHEKVLNGTHHHLKQNGGTEKMRKIQLKRIEEKTHNFQNPEFRERIDNLTRQKVKDGTHPFQNPKNRGSAIASQKVRTCPHCGKVGKGGAMISQHFDKCRKKLLLKDI